ncbi:HVA22 domain membrane protein [Cordyceps fumosorosea ARSEF 2679]|uniref:Protein YOP1 n=1 Tax=Cordyceps fumosorosea (strain ARSEF 2679) TaxID=1081104 RepID=A0A168BXA7_CORFA|nr:HVA22 domain membrane protein [Cordyceps fumosorosea ARSEF 2679]OAA70666.1 HVA22 domain membrane protein [Cordyceps fumosorosea ARSEF 2679]
MFDLPAMLLCSVASFLFPIFASYKALKTSDPAQLTPWLMYWVVFSICLLAESWVSFIVTWIPFYGYFRLVFLLYLILPQTQGARVLYEQYVHPFLRDNESQIDEFIASSHERLKSAGLSYIRQAINYVRENLLGMPPAEPPAPMPENVGAQGYTQALLSRFSIPSAKWATTGAQGSGDFYSLLSSAVAAASGAGAARSAPGTDLTASGHLIPEHLRDSGEKMSFISTQKERLSYLLAALDREAQELQNETPKQATPGAFDGPADADSAPRSPSGLSMLSALSKSRSEGDFEKIDADSGAEDELTMRRRNVSGGGSWMPWGWGGGEGHGEDHGSTTGREH